MRMTKLKKASSFIIALLMAMTFVAQPIIVLADTYDETTYSYAPEEADDYLPEEENEYPKEETDEPPSLFDLLFELIPEITRFAYLTEEAREIALYDFDYLTNMMLQTAPTKHMFYRVFGIELEEFLGLIRQFIYYEVPIPSATVLFMGEDRWAKAPEDTLMIAADYMISLLFLFSIDTGGFGHFGPQDAGTVKQMFFTSAFILQDESMTSEEAFQELEAMGADAVRFVESALQFHQVHYDIYNTPSMLWFYDIDPSEFDFDVNILETIGMMDENNITTYIIEPGRIAYFHIASFMNNMVMDSEVLFPFFYEVQDYEHLIIDIRGNLGGFSGYFPNIVVSMLIGESISFIYPEFFVANEHTADLFENPMSLALADLYGMFPATKFVQSQNMAMFNPDDLDLLDYVAVWNVVYYPWDDAIPFAGEIWLLVDELSMSASVMAAMISANTGFATVVGEPTSRVTGVIYTFAALPNTGVLFRIDLGYTTDLYGRSIEEFGVVPQILNIPGMDALQTVLAVINGVDAQALTNLFDYGPFNYIDGVPYVRLRYVAIALGATVEWDGPTQSVIVTVADGSSFIVAISSYGVINYNGWIYVPVENITAVFADLLA